MNKTQTEKYTHAAFIFYYETKHETYNSNTREKKKLKNKKTREWNYFFRDWYLTS